MENLSWLGLLAVVGLGAWVSTWEGMSGIFSSTHGMGWIAGGLVAVTLTNYPVSQLLRAIVSLRLLVFPEALPSAQDVATQLLRLGQVARAQGGILALQNEGQDGFADGFLNRALIAAIAVREPERVRSILEQEIRQRRILRMEDANVFRVIGTLSPMIGLVGTLLGIILVLRSMSDPMKVGPAMALAITASLYGIGFATFFCLPVAGHIRARAMQETRALEMIVEGVLELLRSDSAFLLEMRINSYAPGTPMTAPIPAPPPQVGPASGAGGR